MARTIRPPSSGAPGSRLNTAKPTLSHPTTPNTSARPERPRWSAVVATMTHRPPAARLGNGAAATEADRTAMPAIRTSVPPRLMGSTSLHFDAVGPLGGRLGDPQGEDAVLQMGLDAVLVDRTG